MEFLTATAPVIFGLMDAKFGRRRRRDVKFGGFSVKLGAASVKFYLAEAALCGTIKEVRLYHTMVHSQDIQEEGRNDLCSALGFAMTVRRLVCT